tara:strand:+ start:10270 stop:11385 length:1116 start_codon:yes stop_codon:yes gene_type:complete
MKILYGIAGEGMGHAIRGKIITEHLIKQGHDVTIVSSNNVFFFLSKHFKKVHKVYGPSFVYENNKLNYIKTFFKNTFNTFPTLNTLKKILKIIKKTNPDVIISDFEPFTNFLAFIKKIPVITLEFPNMCILPCPKKFNKRFLINYYITRIIIRSFILNPKHHMITSFFDMDYKQKNKNHKKYQNISFFQPLIRKEILNINKKQTKVKSKDNYKQKSTKDTKQNILVYQTSSTNTKLMNILKTIDQTFVIYGFDKNQTKNNIIFRKFNEKQFFNDLAQCKAIITNGGFTLISEAICLKKPILSIPIKKQIEQMLNGYYVEKLGYGKSCLNITKKDIELFLNNLNKYTSNINHRNKPNNTKFMNKLDELLSEI